MCSDLGLADCNNCRWLSDDLCVAGVTGEWGDAESLGICLCFVAARCQASIKVCQVFSAVQGVCPDGPDCSEAYPQPPAVASVPGEHGRQRWHDAKATTTKKTTKRIRFATDKTTDCKRHQQGVGEETTLHAETKGHHRHLVTPTLKTDFHREGIFRPSANRKRLSFAPTLTLTLTLKGHDTATHHRISMNILTKSYVVWCCTAADQSLSDYHGGRVGRGSCCESNNCPA